MQNEEGDAHRPREDEFAAGLDVTGSGNAVGALLAPVGHVLVDLRPKEVEAEVVKHFVSAHVTSGGGGMVGREDGVVKGLGNDNQQKRMGVIAELLGDDEMVVEDRYGIGTQEGAIGCG